MNSVFCRLSAGAPSKPAVTRRALLAGLVLGTLSGAGAAPPELSATPVPLSERVAVGEIYGGIRLLGSLRLPAAPVSGLTPNGLSDLAWDEDAGLLYAVSDRGKLFHLRPVFQDDRLVDARLVQAYLLRDRRGKPLAPPFADAEGLTIQNGANGRPGDSQLLISFEVRPRIVRYSPRGNWLKEEPLPALLRNPQLYANPNKGLEALALHPRWGLLVGIERPLRGQPKSAVPIYAQDGLPWSYPLYPAPNSSLVAMQVLPDGSLLTLERAFVSLLNPLIIALRRAPLTVPGEPLTVQDVAVFDTSRGWLLDNFEGLARHRGQRFFMISDDNRSVLQSTLLVYFELLPDGAFQAAPAPGLR